MLEFVCVGGCVVPECICVHECSRACVWLRVCVCKVYVFARQCVLACVCVGECVCSFLSVF